ncbi:MAG: integrase core domain-containing protein [Pirellulaceae bacterium]
MRSPNTVAFVERFVQTIKQECLDHFIVFGEQHMSLLCSEFREHYHLERPHQGLENERPTHTATKKSGKLPKPADTIRLSDIRCEERLGGILKSYSRKAA